MSKTDFLYPYAPYQGDLTSEDLILNANLQGFANRVNLIVALQTGGKLSIQEAYQQIEALWQELSAQSQPLK